MMPAPSGARPVLVTPTQDPAIRLARGLFLLGLAAVSLMVFRVGASFTVGDILLLASFFLTALCAPEERKRLTVPVFMVMIMVFIGGSLSAAFSDDVPGTFLVLGRVLYVAFLLPWQTMVLLDTEQRLRAGIAWTAIGAAVCSLGTVVQLLFGNVIPGSVAYESGRFPGFAVHVSDTGAIAALAAVFGLALILAESPAGHRIVGVFAMASGMVGLVLSGSVSGMLAAIVGAVLILLFRRVKLWIVVMVAATATVVLNFALSLVNSTGVALSPLERFYQVIGVTGNEVSLNTTASRLTTDVLGWEGFLQLPFTGVGLGSSASLVIGELGVHNLYLSALHQGGIFFGVGIMIVTLAILFRSVRWVRTEPLGAVLFAGALSALVFAMTAPSFFNRYFWVPFALLAAYDWNKRREAEKHPS